MKFVIQNYKKTKRTFSNVGKAISFLKKNHIRPTRANPAQFKKFFQKKTKQIFNGYSLVWLDSGAWFEYSCKQFNAKEFAHANAD